MGGDVAADIGEGVLFVRHNEMIEMTSEVLGQVFTKGSESGIGKL